MNKFQMLIDMFNPTSDAMRSMNTGTPQSNAELIKFHKDKLKAMGPNAPKSHRAYHEKFIKRLSK